MEILGNRLLLYGSPGCPIHEVGDKLSALYDIDFYTIEREPAVGDMYFSDKIPSVKVDTGDLMTGSESQHMGRDFFSLKRDELMDQVSMPNPQITPLSDEEISEINSIRTGIVATEIPDYSLLGWATHVAEFDCDKKFAIEWFHGRRKCFSCGAVYHIVEKPPKVPGICDRCGTDLKRRMADHRKMVSHQFRVWKKDFADFQKLSKEEKNYKLFNIEESSTLDGLARSVESWFRESVSSLAEKSLSYWSS